MGEYERVLVDGKLNLLDYFRALWAEVMDFNVMRQLLALPRESKCILLAGHSHAIQLYNEYHDDSVKGSVYFKSSMGEFLNPSIKEIDCIQIEMYSLLTE